MKKLAFVAAAALAGACFADSAITSANVVGYATKTTDKPGFAVFTPMFQNVDTTKDYSIQDIVPVSGFAGDGSEEIQILGADGNVAKSFVWCSADIYGKQGWYNDQEKLADEGISAGQSFLLYNPNATGYSVQFAGQVNYVSGSIKSDSSGFVVAGNSTPVDISIQKFAPISGFEGEGAEEIQVLDNGGVVVETFVYCKAGLLGSDAGWYDESGFSTRIIKAGEGFLIYNPASQFQITIPAVTK